MEKFYNTHKYLLEHTNGLIKRSLEQEIDWNSQMIGIKGARGIGKTSFLISYAQTNFTADDRRCLYINLNTFYFSNCTLLDFIEEFRKQGGRILLLDQVYKYANWSIELRECYEKFSDVQVIFTSSSVWSLNEEDAHLESIVDFYSLRGLSFREYLNKQLNLQIPSFSLEELMTKHEYLTQNLLQQIAPHDPMDYLFDYLHHGYYPFYLDKSNYTENLLKMINFMIEIDICYLRQVEMKYLPKLRKLFYILAQNSPCNINISKLSKEISTSRATVLNYLKYMKDARLFNLLYPQGEESYNKPEHIYLDNTNLMYLMNESATELKPEHSEIGITYFYNMVHKDHKLKSIARKNTFMVDNQWSFELKDKLDNTKKKSDYSVVNGIKKGTKDLIPLWIFGFLY